MRTASVVAESAVATVLRNGGREERGRQGDGIGGHCDHGVTAARSVRRGGHQGECGSRGDSP
eukprot:2118004-Pleurochrysis_carterae.AAC.1